MASSKNESEIEYIKQLDSDTNKLISVFGAGSISDLSSKPAYRWLP
ncbi:MAG: hypothetical protein ACP5K5_00335 [Candidatus Micrarchaeia archaeon]